MRAAVLKPCDVRHVDAVLRDNEGRPRVVPAAALEALPPGDVQWWCFLEGVYGLVTEELVAWLKRRIGARKAIEVGAGNGCLGRALGIPATDSFVQERLEIRAYMTAMGQPLTRYGADVERLEALEAVEKYRPQVVIGMWVTQWVDPEDRRPPPGSIYGIKEERILDHPDVETYIVVGHMAVHGQKRILSRSVQLTQATWLWSRAADQAGACILTWDRP